MFMCVVNLKLVNKLDLTWKQSFLIHSHRCLIFRSVSEMIQTYVEAKIMITSSE
jgi:hypothetical protein